LEVAAERAQQFEVRVGQRCRERPLFGCEIIGVVMRPWLAVPVVLALGLAVRAFTGGDFAKYAGVALYATLIYALAAFWLRSLPAALVATGFSWAVEFFQLTGIPADLSARSGLAHLVLGSTFNAPDLFWYVVGAALGVVIVRARAGSGGPGLQR
jgi:hypothetical protein